jgi:myo-inositol-1-phosphate synthase
VPAIKDFLPLADLKDLVFGAWDIFPDSATKPRSTPASSKKINRKTEEAFTEGKPMKAVFDQTYVKRLNGTNVKKGKNKLDLANQLIAEIAEFKKKNRCDRLVMIWAASTEIFMKPHAVHRHDEFARAGDARQSQGDSAFDGLRVRGIEIRNSLRERRA